MERTDVLILGCGIAGATAALELARDRSRRVTVLSRALDPQESNSSWAQGGIVGRGRDDTAELLVEDVLRAGAGLSYPPAVQQLAQMGPALLDEVLVERCGIAFDRGTDGAVQYGLEAAHSRRRILHVGDATGKAIMDGLLAAVRAQPNIELLHGRTAVDLLTFPHHSPDPLDVYRASACYGAYVLAQDTGRVEPLIAPHTVLATGGLGQIYLNTTNPPGARGDGLAMAYRAGARVVNAEYVQFHPTALHMPGTTKTLISEAVRGEGGRLLTPEGRPFLEKYAPEERELAPRDVVARAIFLEMLAHDYPFVLLDIASQMSPEAIRARFPGIHRACLQHGIDITQRPIPVVPAAHYFCGGVLVDLDGRTNIPGLYAVGEVACTGVHGANRLASTSLLEGLVWGMRAAQDIRRAQLGGVEVPAVVPTWDDTGLEFDTDPALIQGDMQTVRTLMWHYVGLIRNRHRLTRAVREVRRLWLNIEEFYRKSKLVDGLVGLRNAALVALVLAKAAHRNPTSRGAHFREDARPGRGAVPPPVAASLESESD